MTEYRKYLDEIINNSYNEIVPIISKIRNIKRCSGCNGSYVNSNCKYCGAKNEELEVLLNSLESMLKRFCDKLSNLPIEKMYINKLFNLLYSINNVEISTVKELLQNYNYPTLYSGFLEQTLDKLKIFDTELSPLEISTLETIIYRNDNSIDMRIIQDFFIHNALFKEQNISYDCFCKLVQQFVISFMKDYYPSSECIIQEEIPDHKDSVGGSVYDLIYLKENEIRKLYYEGKYDIFLTIFHELTHTMQFRHIFDNDNFVMISSFTIDELKEHILSHETDWYHKENYDMLSYEYEADYYGVYLMDKYLSNLNYHLNHEITQQKITEFEKSMHNKNRTRNGEPTTIEMEFEKVIQNRPDLLKKYKKLNYLYKVVGDEVVAKTREDLIEDSQNILNNPNMSEEYKTMMVKFYEEYISLNRS